MKNIFFAVSVFFASHAFSAQPDDVLSGQLDRLYAQGMRTEWQERKNQAYHPQSACYRSLGTYIAELRSLNAGSSTIAVCAV